ncbi:MAG: amidohydrolase [Gammaproteobacteria bacterium]|nr:MAG: amidohydrolase [Gammaproteobacteria bacterium]
MSAIKTPALIDVHTHVVPASIPSNPLTDSLERWPQVRCGECGHRTVYHGDKPFRTLAPNAWDVEQRVLEMDDQGVGMQVLSPMPELLGYWLDPRQTEVLADCVNASIATMVVSRPERFVGFGMVTLQDPVRAVREVERIAKVFGLSGIEIGSHVNGTPIGDARFAEFFAAVAANDLALFVHAIHPSRERIVGPPLMEALVAFPQELALAGMSLMAGQVLESNPDLRLCLSHVGGTLPWISGRIRHGWQVAEDVRATFQTDPAQWIRQVWHDTLVYDPQILQGLIGRVGVNRLMIGTDYPFLIQETDPAGVIDALGRDTKVRRAIAYDNAVNYLKL